MFPLDSSEVLVRRGCGAYGSTLCVRAGETVEIAVQIKDRFGPFTDAAVEHLMREIVLVPKPRNSVSKQVRRVFSTSLGVATFEVMLRNKGDLQVSAAVIYRGKTQIIGCGVKIKVKPGEVRLESLSAKEVVEVGEEVELVVQLEDSDVFCNSMSETEVLELVDSLHLKCFWTHNDRLAARQSALSMMKPRVLGTRRTSWGKTFVALQLALLDLQLPGLHTFEVKSSTQAVRTQVQVVEGKPHELRLNGLGRAQVLRRFRWSCTAHVLNRYGRVTTLPESTTFRAMLVSSTLATEEQSWPLQVRVVEHMEAVKGCSLANVHAEREVQELEISLLEADIPLCKGEYQVRALIEQQECAPVDFIEWLRVEHDRVSWELQHCAERELKLASENATSPHFMEWLREEHERAESRALQDICDAEQQLKVGHSSHHDALPMQLAPLDSSDKGEDRRASKRKRNFDSDQEDEPQSGKIEFGPISIVLEPPLDPAHWSAYDVAYSLKEEGLAICGSGDFVTGLLFVKPVCIMAKLGISLEEDDNDADDDDDVCVFVCVCSYFINILCRRVRQKADRARVDRRKG